MAMAMSALPTAEATLALLRWRQTRRGYDGDAELLTTGCALLQAAGGESPLQHAERLCNVPASRIVMEAIHYALMLVTKPKRDDTTNQGHQVLRLLHLGLRALRRLAASASAKTNGSSNSSIGATATSGLSIPLNACNLLLVAMNEALDQTTGRPAAELSRVVVDVQQIFVFLFGMLGTDATGMLSTPSFNMYKPPTNVFTTFMQRAYTAIVAQLDVAEHGAPAIPELVRLLHAITVVFQELQRTQLNKKKVFLAIAKTSLRDIVAYRHALVKHQALDGVDVILGVLDRVVVDALFDGEHLREYDGAFVNLHMWIEAPAGDASTSASAAPSATKKQRRNRKNDGGAGAAASGQSLVSYQRHLFDELKALLQDVEASTELKLAVGPLMGVLVQGYSSRIRAAANDKIEDTKAELKSSKKRVASVIAVTSTTYSPFKFWAELCAVASAASQGAEDAASQALLVNTYDALFQALCEADVYRVTEDTEEQEQFHMMQAILTRFIGLLQAQPPTGDGAERAMTHVCHVIANAVRCTPNLVNTTLVPIFMVLGGASAVVLEQASAAMTELLQAYESMRLIDAFLKSCCGVNDANEAVARGLGATFAHKTTETALRRTFMTLPPGQVEIVWRLFVDKLAVLCASKGATIYKMALVRSLFAVFVQELHITPQNRTKICELVEETHEKLTVTLVSTIERFRPKSSTFSEVQKEIFSVFGELLALYDGLSASTRSKTLDTVLTALEPHIAAVVAKLLHGDGDLAVGVSSGIIKIGVHWLRKDAVRAAPSVETSKQIVTLIVERVVAWACWDSVAFYLPELVEDLPREHATELFVKLLGSLTADDTSTAAASRILCDAAFYEILSLRRVSASVFAKVVKELLAKSEPRQTKTFFEFLLTVPVGYVDDSAGGDLVMNVLKLHKASTSDPAMTPALVAMNVWLQRNLVRLLSASINGKTEKKMTTEVTSWTRHLSFDADRSCFDLVSVVVGAIVESKNDKVATGLRGVLSELVKLKSSRVYSVGALVLDALASHCGSAAAESTLSVTSFVGDFISLLASQGNSFGEFQASHEFDVFESLVKVAAREGVFDGAMHQRVDTLVQSHLEAALGAALQCVVVLDAGAAWDERETSALGFFQTFCEVYRAIRPAVSLETFGRLLAAALVLSTAAESASMGSQLQTSSNALCAPLASLVAHANKEEFRLLLETVAKEIRAPEPPRVLAALKSLVFLLESDRKLPGPRRQLLGEHKAELLEAFVALFARSLEVGGACPTKRLVSLWTLRCFVLFYCKAELFSWKPHELLLVFTGFQPLMAISSRNNPETWPLEHVHAVWSLSYTLLLRIVRHHFASLVNGVSHMVDTLGALLQVLVAHANATDPALAAARLPRVLEWGANLARLYGYLKPHDAVVRKHVVYLLLAYLEGVTHGALPVPVQLKLRPGIYALLEICSTFEKEQLYASLDAPGKSLLKSLDTSYKLSYRYVGKV